MVTHQSMSLPNLIAAAPNQISVVHNTPYSSLGTLWRLSIKVWRGRSRKKRNYATGDLLETRHFSPHLPRLPLLARRDTWMLASEFYLLFLLISYCSDLLHMMVILQRIHSNTSIQYIIQYQLHINDILLLHVN